MSSDSKVSVQGCVTASYQHTPLGMYPDKDFPEPSRCPRFTEQPLAPQGCLLVFYVLLEPEATQDERDQPNKEGSTLEKFSSDEVVMPPSPSYADDFRAFQDLMKGLTESLHTALEEGLVVSAFSGDILHVSSQCKVALPINEALFSPA